MISISEEQFRYVPNTIGFSKEDISIQKVVHEFQEVENLEQDEVGLLRIIQQISFIIKKKEYTLSTIKSIGLLLFNDRILMNPFIFAIFIDWDEEILNQIISNSSFNRTPLTRQHFHALLYNNYIEGCLFDWCALCYPANDYTINIINNIQPTCDESFFLIADMPSTITGEKTPKLTYMSSKLFSKPQTKNLWTTYSNLTFEDIILKFADDPVAPGKCWLLYKEDE